MSSAGIGLIFLIIAVTIAIGVSALVYFLPAVIGFKRKHQSSLAIFMLNLFLGWTLLFWVASLVWACTKVEKSN